MNGSYKGNVNNSAVYYISDAVVPYYISIPNTDNPVTMVFNITNNPKEFEGVTNEVTQKILKEYAKFTQNNIAVITPIIETEIMKASQQAFNDSYNKYFENVLMNLSRLSFNFLSANRKTPIREVHINDNEANRELNNYMVKKYPSIIRVVKYAKEEPITRMSLDSRVGNINVAEVENSSIPLTETLNAAQMEGKEIAQSQGKVKVLKKEKRREPGFVSYVLLGVIVAILSLIGLYLLL